MKTDISHIPPKRQRELEYIVSVLLKEFEEDIRLATTEIEHGRLERVQHRHVCILRPTVVGRRPPVTALR